MIIYIIKNKINGKCYIGKTNQTLQKRWYNHKHLAKKKENRNLYNAMNEYGIENFHPSILERVDNCSDEYLSEREIYWILKYNSNNILYGYNMTKGGTGGDVISSHPDKDAIIKKMSDSRKGKSYEQIMGAEKATALKALLREKMLGNLSPLYKDIDKEELKEMVDKGHSNIELAEYFLVSRQTISSKFKSFFGMTLTEYRKINNLPIRRRKTK